MHNEKWTQHPIPFSNLDMVLFVFLGIAVFIAIAAMSFLGVEVAWWLCILVAACVAVPPAILTLSSRKKANAPAGERSVSEPVEKPLSFYRPTAPMF